MTEETKKADILKGIKPTLKKTTSVDEELLKKHQQMVNFLKNEISTIEVELKKMYTLLTKLEAFDPTNPKSLELSTDVQEITLNTYTEEGMEVIEGVFDGYFMVGGDQKKYPVPMNYSSKTKLVPGDILKLKVMTNGQFVYKLTKPAERKHLKAILSRTDDNKYIANTTDGNVYFLNQAAVTFFKGLPGDELYIIVNEKDENAFAAIEAIIKK
ncbi:MAG: hypothetical protein LBP53_00715 [Candidatus Peribacteria bacterium]|jgi:hypothetical protein|nr:hypothetical protein [Candidatus Peribacteria bacterium]